MYEFYEVELSFKIDVPMQRRVVIDPEHRANVLDYLNAVPANTGNVQLHFLRGLLITAYSLEDILAALREIEEAEVDNFLPNISRFGQR